MQTFYFNIFFGESWPYVVKAESLHQAVQIAFEDMKKWSYDFTSMKIREETKYRIIYSDESWDYLPDYLSEDDRGSWLLGAYPHVEILDSNWHQLPGWESDWYHSTDSNDCFCSLDRIFINLVDGTHGPGITLN